MSALFLNLPNKNQIMRRYMCSYNSPTFLFQPIELLSLAGIYKAKNAGKTFLIDAIAENIDFNELSKRIEDIKPSFICSITGFECFEEDINELNLIQEKFPNIPILIFGHYATEFHDEIMHKTNVHFIIHGEPDLVFDNFLDEFLDKKNYTNVNSISYRDNGLIHHNKGTARIKDINKLPFPAFELLKNDYYSEPFFKKPYGLIQSARGCPFQCNYCVKSFGTNLGVLSPENIIAQIEEYIDLFSIKSFRFIDDTFTATPKRVIEFCKLMVEKKYNHLEWSCLARTDTLQAEMLEWMKKAGCKRIYIGVESGSAHVLEYYNKKIDLDKSIRDIRYAKSLGYELMGFFMVGAPTESLKDVNASIKFAKKAGFEFVDITKLTPYPGTLLYEKMKDEIDFSILPYKNNFKNEEIDRKANFYQRYFMLRFYLSPIVIFNIIQNRIFSSFSEFSINGLSFLKYLVSFKKGETRKDYI